MAVSGFCAHTNATKGASGHMICLDCGTALDAPREQETARLQDEVMKLPASTTTTIPGRQAVSTLGIVGAESVQGIGLDGDLMAGFANVFGGRSQPFERGFFEARHQVLYSLKAQAHAMGANGLIGVSFDQHLTAAQTGSASMLMVTGTATAVVLAAVGADGLEPPTAGL